MKRYLVVGRGLVGKMLAEGEQFELISHTEFHESPATRSYDGYVCTAAISGERACQDVSWTEVVQANVALPFQLIKRARRDKAPVVLFSTSGVYRYPGVAKEDDDVEPHNRYTTSKLVMEHCALSMAYSKCYVFRIPFICLFVDGKMDMPNRVRAWTKCENVNTSILYKKELLQSVLCALGASVPSGVYNVMSENIRLPEFVKEQFDWHGEVVPQGSLGLTPSTCLDISKANTEGLIK